MVEGPQYEDVEVGSDGGDGVAVLDVVVLEFGVLFCYNKLYQTKFEETSRFLGFFETDHF